MMRETRDIRRLGMPISLLSRFPLVLTILLLDRPFP
jgi:hypothetical protein